MSSSFENSLIAKPVSLGVMPSAQIFPTRRTSVTRPPPCSGASCMRCSARIGMHNSGSALSSIAATSLEATDEARVVVT
eukprot:3059593-Pleurochrysis_carterae.AAC.1